MLTWPKMYVRNIMGLWPKPRLHTCAGLIQVSLCKIQGLSRTSKRLTYCFQGLKT